MKRAEQYPLTFDQLQTQLNAMQNAVTTETLNIEYNSTSTTYTGKSIGTTPNKDIVLISDKDSIHIKKANNNSQTFSLIIKKKDDGTYLAKITCFGCIE